ncbi:MAG TPA: methyltransferase domain-containing protein [Deltaproteobacteria bacterium]|jgi:SAM-dependent methyltransferase|nr:methyltransferase domain-containing protein [Deltaproteobacteria bacterium]
MTDWLLLWGQIIEEQGKSHTQDHAQGKDVWKDRAKGFHENVKKRWSRPDSSRTFILERLKENPGSTVLDIGAGTGAWTCLLAQYAGRVVAVEPSGAMASFLRKNVEEMGLANVEVIEETWPEARTGTCDFSLCSHAMYGYPDLERFIFRMEEVTEKTCFLLLRAPTLDGVMAEAAMRVWGQPHDSPNFQIAYNALLQMGICPNVLMEDTGLWEPWRSGSIGEALEDVKRRLGLVGESEHDGFLRDLLERRLTFEDGAYVWPRGVRSALVYWDARKEG